MSRPQLSSKEMNASGLKIQALPVCVKQLINLYPVPSRRFYRLLLCITYPWALAGIFSGEEQRKNKPQTTQNSKLNKSKILNYVTKAD